MQRKRVLQIHYGLFLSPALARHVDFATLRDVPIALPPNARCEMSCHRFACNGKEGPLQFLDADVSERDFVRVVLQADKPPAQPVFQFRIIVEIDVLNDLAVQLRVVLRPFEP